MSEGAHATGQRHWSRPGAGQFHRYFVPMPPRTHPDGRGGASSRRRQNRLARRSKGAYLSGVRRSHSADLLAERFQRLLDDPRAPIHRFLDRNKARWFLVQPKDYGKPSDAGLLFADQPPDGILPRGMRCMVWNSLLTNCRVGGIVAKISSSKPEKRS